MTLLKQLLERYTQSQILLVGSSALIIAFTFLIMNNLWILVFAAIFGAIAFVFFLNKPKETFIVLMVVRLIIDLLWVIPFSVGGFGLLEAFSGGSTVACVLLIIIVFKDNFERHPSVHFFLFWNAFLFIHMAFTPFSPMILSEFFRIFSPVLVYALASSFLTDDDAPFIMELFAYAGAIPLLTSLYHLATGQMNTPDMMVHGIKRLVGGYQNLRHAGLVMLIITNLGLLQFIKAYETDRKLWIVIWGGYTGAAFLCLYLTQIRSSLLPFVMGIPIFFALTRRKNVMYGLTIIGVAAIAVSPSIQDRFKDIILIFTIDSEDTQALNAVGSGRYGIWSGSWEEFQKRPFLQRMIGLGYNGHVALTSATFLAFDKISGRNYDPHNDYLFLIYNFGPIGAIAYTGMAVQAMIAAVKVTNINFSREHRDIAAICLVIMFGLMINNTMSNGTVKRVTVGWYFWCFAGLVFGMLRSYEKKFQEQMDKRPKKRKRLHSRHPSRDPRRPSKKIAQPGYPRGSFHPHPQNK